MTPASFAKYVRTKTNTSPATFPDSKILDIMNVVKDDMVTDVANIDENLFGMIATRNLVANQREYFLPEQMLNRMVRLEIDIKGDGKYIKMDEFDLAAYTQGNDEESIRRYFADNKKFALFREAIFLYTRDPIIDVVDGLRCYYIRFPDDITDLTSTTQMLSNNYVYPIGSGIMRQLHKYWATKVIVEYKESKDKPIPLTASEQVLEQTYQGILAQLRNENMSRVTTGHVPDYDNGFNY